MKLLLYVLVLIQVYNINGYEQMSEINNGNYNKKNKDECVKRLNEFSDKHKNFIQCSIEYGHPIKICEKCLNKFIDSNIHYKMVTENYNGTNCYEHFIDQDRINIVSLIYNDGVNVWNKAYCKDCYDWHDNTMNLNFSSETKNLLNHLNETNTCIKNNYATDVCGACAEKYRELNNLFISMEEIKKSQICFDIQDAMNQTRVRWSKEMKCCEERESSLLGFTLMSSTFSIVIVLFYVAVPYFEIRTDSNRLPAINHSTEESQQSRATNDSNLEGHGNIITGLVMPSPSSSKLKHRGDDNDSTEDDDEELVRISKN